MRRLLRGVPAVLATALVALTVHAAPQHPSYAENGPKDEQKLMLVLDSSGSMKEPDTAGMSKMRAAKQAFAELIPKLPAGAHVGLRVYGAKVFDPDDPKACTDSQLVHPVQPLDGSAKSGMAEEIAKVKPYGETPISYSLRQAAKDLGKSGKRTILLVSDGEERCDPDPCKTARTISGLGIDLKIDVVGLHVSKQARDQLRCIADSGNGTFYEADDAVDLAAGLKRLSTRAFRPFKVDGRPVLGSTSPEQARTATALSAGQYVDSAPKREQTKYYRLRRTIPGSTLHVGASARPAPGATTASLQLGTKTLDGWSCSYGVGTEMSFARTNPVVTATVGGKDDPKERSRCFKANELILSVKQEGRASTPEDGDLGGLPMELILVEEPPVSNPTGLPGPANEHPKWTEPSIGSGVAAAEEVEPGASFSDSPTVKPGKYSTSMFPGEVQFYRVRLDWGQRLHVKASALKPDAKLAGLIDYPQGIDLRLIGPTRGGAVAVAAGATIEKQSFLNENSDAPLRALTSEIRYTNRTMFDGARRAAALPGDYYIAVSLGNDMDGESYLVPFDLSIGVVGPPGGGAPTYTGGKHLIGPGVEGPFAAPKPLPDAPSATGPGSSAGEGGANGLLGGMSDRLLPAGIAALVGLGIIVVIMVVRRRRHRGEGVHTRSL